MKKELTKEDLIEEVVKAAKEDDTFMCKVEKAIEESKIISTIEANFIAAHIADIFKLNVDPKSNLVVATVVSFNQYIQNIIGYHYIKDLGKNIDSGILYVLSNICTKVKEKDFKNFKKYFLHNNRATYFVDIFELKEKLLEKAKNGRLN